MGVTGAQDTKKETEFNVNILESKFPCGTSWRCPAQLIPNPSPTPDLQVALVVLLDWADPNAESEPNPPADFNKVTSSGVG